ncbi:MAG: NUDIX domain-containing protein [Nanoarchaeota archaeon]|nr:NUDIX domain-containing protein [Nanoarchaeota archaeon]
MSDEEKGTKLASSVIVPLDDGIFLVKTAKDGKYGLPGGKVNYLESVVYASQREVKEETGLDVVITGIVGFYQFQSERGNMIFHSVFSSKLITRPGEINDSLSFEEGKILDVDDFSLRKIREFYEEGALRYPGEATLESIEDYFRGRRFPLESIKTFLPYR